MVLNPAEFDSERWEKVYMKNYSEFFIRTKVFFIFLKKAFIFLGVLKN
jgi:hypothetical protein